MSENPVWFALASLYAVIASLALALYAGRIGERLGLMDHPADIKLHRQATPLIGGLALMVVLVPLLPIFMFIFEPEGLGNRALSVIVIGTLLLALVGMGDDRSDFSPKLRFALALAIFGGAMLIEPRIIIDSLRITGFGSSMHIALPIAFAFTLAIHVGFINAVNMADGKNGLVIGLCLIWLLFLLWVGPAGLIIVALPLIQCLAVLLVFNLKGRLFLGDGGTYGLSAFLGMISIYAYNLADGGVSADRLALLYLIPGADMLRLFFVRILRGRSPFAGDRDHFHHLLEARFGWPGGLTAYLALVAAPVIAGLLVPAAVPALFCAGLAFYLLLVIWLRRERADRAAFKLPAE